MSEHVYKVEEIVGSSVDGIEDAIEGAVTRAGKTIRNMAWFEVVEIRGHISEGEVAHYQVKLKIGFTLDDGKS
jgi:dodecin